MKKTWCDVCKFLTYGCHHVVSSPPKQLVAETSERDLVAQLMKQNEEMTKTSLAGMHHVLQTLRNEVVRQRKQLGDLGVLSPETLSLLGNLVGSLDDKQRAALDDALTPEQKALLDVVRPREETNTELVFMGFSVCVPGFGTSVVWATPQVTLKPRRFHIPKEIAPDFDITALRVGYMHKLASATPVPASCFSAPVDLEELKKADAIPFDNIAGFRPIKLGESVYVTVTNLSPCARNFRAMMAGDALFES